MQAKSEAEKLLQENRTIFFCGKYIQGGISVGVIADCFLCEDTEYVEYRIFDFVESVNTIYDKTDIANFIIEYREDILRLLK